jgi:hypothetical protein
MSMLGRRGLLHGYVTPMSAPPSAQGTGSARTNRGRVQIHARTVRVEIAGQHAIGRVQATFPTPAVIKGHFVDRARPVRECCRTYPASSDPALTSRAGVKSIALSCR